MPGCGSCASAKERRSESSVTIKSKPVTAVRYGRMNHIGEFSLPLDLALTCGGKVVVSTVRGIELGEQVQKTCGGCASAVPTETMHRYAENSGEDFYRRNAGRVLRQATEEDLIEQKHIDAEVPEKIKTCQRFADELGLEMRIVEGEHILGGERIVFYFMAEHRVDFRELVRMLAREFQTRIEMKQVGARDEARLLADYETCGREVCCKNFLKTLRPVTMQMAKMQKATLDPSKVSGRCGRLKCCLRYEHESYSELSKKLPKVGKRIASGEYVGKVVDRQVLTQLVRIRTDDGKIVTIPCEEITDFNVPYPSREDDSGPKGRGGDDRGRPSRGRRRSSDEKRSPRDQREQNAGPDKPSDEATPDERSGQDGVSLNVQNGGGATEAPPVVPEDPAAPDGPEKTSEAGEQSDESGETAADEKSQRSDDRPSRRRSRRGGRRRGKRRGSGKNRDSGGSGPGGEGSGGGES